MHAIIPVAGVGTRLRPHTYEIPKVLLTVAGKPILAHILDKITADGITRATIIIGHLGKMIEEFVKTSYPDLNATFVVQEELHGLGHAIHICRDEINDEPILIILGDTVFDVDLKAVIAEPHSALGVKHVDDPRRFGIAEITDGYISRLIEKPEKPTSNLALVGIYSIANSRLLVSCLDELVSRNIRTKGEYQLTDALQMMIERGEKMKTFSVEGWYDCGKPETLLSTNQALLVKKSTPRKFPGVIINEPVFIAPTAELSNCIVGPFTSVGEGAMINGAVVANSIIGEGAIVQSVLLHDSIVGNGAIVKGNFKRLNVGGSSEVQFY